MSVVKQRTRRVAVEAHFPEDLARQLFATHADSMGTNALLAGAFASFASGFVVAAFTSDSLICGAVGCAFSVFCLVYVGLFRRDQSRLKQHLDSILVRDVRMVEGDD